MHIFPGHHGLPQRLTDERLGVLWRRGMRLAKRLAIAFGLSAAAAIAIGAAATDNAFAQILVTAFAAFALWLPFLFLIMGAERLFARPSQRLASSTFESGGSVRADRSWRRLAALVPGEAERVAFLRSSLDRSRLVLGKADLDPDAHDLCVLIDRRLPELIDRELDDLPPDDRGRRDKLSELVGLIEQFARECSRKRSGDSAAPGYQAEVLRRRFEARLSDQ